MIYEIIYFAVNVLLTCFLIFFLVNTTNFRWEHTYNSQYDI